MWDILKLCHEGSKVLKKVKLSALMNEYENFILKDNETMREIKTRYQITMNALKQLHKTIPQEEINMKIKSSAPSIYQLKVTILEASPMIDKMDTLVVFAKLK